MQMLRTNSSCAALHVGFYTAPSLLSIAPCPPFICGGLGRTGRPEGSERYRDFHLTSYLVGWGRLGWSEQCVDGAGANIDFTFLRYTNLCYSAILAPIFPAPSLLACQYALPTLSMQCQWCVAELRSA